MATRLPSPVGAEAVSSGRRSLVRLVAWAVVLLIPVFFLFSGNDESSDDSRAPRAAAAHAPSSSIAPKPSATGPAGKHLPRARPTRLLIPAIGVSAPFVGLAIGDSGQLEPPPADDTNLVGWQADGVSPGEAGTAIIAGHVDTATSAAVFAGLSELKKGNRFSVNRSDGRTAVFVVDSVETFAKDDFPDQRVYADTPQAQVRLITCAGDYDHAVRDYTDNLVVFAHLV
ncbi:class F sortase [Streptomyces sp. WI04-05B]|uniref:class F sortase n=1 Tax=Streptomyces TaxID=1883 RepID=UPI0029A0DA68|nr:MULTISPECIES: class F sortase [unclassified Streptomyces]MDX2546929.1 class F sortase [Streptomyces sp. WI04-05B]MDX2589313.1 class F sortase [Streptomyces sp. WI04-05A]